VSTKKILDEEKRCFGKNAVNVVEKGIGACTCCI
jgi:hypothetical protein